MKKSISFLVLLVLLIPSTGTAACSWVVDSQATAASASRSDVADCMDDANFGDGDTLIIPAGSETWDDPIVINNNITIQGAGTSLTTLKTNDEASASADGVFFITAEKTVKISGIRFEPTTKVDANAYNAAIWLNGSNGATVIYDCIFDGFKWAIFSWSNPGVVVAGNTFYNGGIQLYGAVANWDSALTFGDNDWFFIEGNSFYATTGQSLHFVLGYIGAKIVFRHNNIESTSDSVYVSDPFDIHGYGHASGANARSGRGWDAYNNYFLKFADSGRAFYLRGGTGVIHDNVFNNVDGIYTGGEINLSDYRLSNPTALAGPAGSAGSWNCASGTGANIGCAAQEGEPCCDQIGTGVSQAREPAYIWDNYKCTTDPCLSNLSLVAPVIEESSVGYIDENEDYYLSEKSGYSKATCPHTSIGLTGKYCDDTQYGTAGYGLDANNALTVTKAGTGTGTVTSSPSGINCGETCEFSYESGNVTLTATATEPNYFVGWSGTGGCTGTSTCVLTMSAAKAVTATFSLRGTITPGSGGSIVSGSGGSFVLQ